MSLTRKSGVTKASVVGANPTPESLFAPLPERVIKRFPEMEQWHAENQERVRQWTEALDRRTEELELRIAALEGS